MRDRSEFLSQTSDADEVLLKCEGGVEKSRNRKQSHYSIKRLKEKIE